MDSGLRRRRRVLHAYGRSFTFAIRLGGLDANVCEVAKQFFRVGTTHWYPRREPHFDDEVVYQVRALRDLVEVIVPFMDEHLPPSYKRTQYAEWRTALLDHRERGRRRTPHGVNPTRR